MNNHDEMLPQTLSTEADISTVYSVYLEKEKWLYNIFLHFLLKRCNKIIFLQMKF